MANEHHVLLNSDSLPTASQLSLAVHRFLPSFQVPSDLNLRLAGGFVPCTFDDTPTGVEIYFESSLDFLGSFDLVSASLDCCLTFRWSTRASNALCALVISLALVRDFSGYFAQEDETPHRNDSLIQKEIAFFRPKAERELRSGKHLASLLRQVSGPTLLQSGFREIEPGGYRRSGPEGIDELLLDGPHSGRFSIFIGFTPRYILRVIEAISGQRFREFGFMVGPYLTPVCIAKHPKKWRCESKKTSRSSIDQVHDGILCAGLPWLDRLRDPIFFSTQIIAGSHFIQGYAMEHAGRLDDAQTCYREEVTLFSQFFSERDPSSLLDDQDDHPWIKSFLLASERLSENSEGCKQLRNALDFHFTLDGA